MYISALRIRNFRNFRTAKFEFEEGVNTLLGENGSGKTNALFAMRLLLDETLSRNAARLMPRDFSRSLARWQGQWVMIAVDFEDLDPSEGCQILKHESGHIDGTETGTYMLSYRPKTDIRQRLFELTCEKAEDEEFEKLLLELTVDDYEPVYSGRSTIDLLDDDEYRTAVGDFDKYEFPNPNDDDQNLLGVRTNSPIHAEITCTFVQALRDAVSDLRGYRNNPLLALLRGTESGIDAKDAEHITDAVANLNSDISSLAQIREIATGIQTTLHTTVGHSFSPSVSIESMLPDELDKLLQRLAVTVGDDIEIDYRGDISELSLGGANLIYLALKLLEYEVKLSSDRVAHFLLIEEPEAHIHSHVQKTLFESQASMKTQVIVSSHSTHISSAARIGAINVLARKGSEAKVYQPANGLSDDTVGRLERYLDAVRSTLLFAKGVILVEGDTELVLIPALIKAVFGLSADELGISVISMDSAFFEHVAVVFADARIHRKCAIVTDKDSSIITLDDETENDSVEEAHARAAEQSGIQRKSALDAFVDGNKWVNAFFATHTFEVDFVAENNSREVINTLDTIYSQATAKKNSTMRLKSKNIETCGAEILRLAKKVGKGWFALLLAEQLEVDTFLPPYILNAIAFAASENISDSIISKMARYRLGQELFDEEIKGLIDLIGDPQTMTDKDIIDAYTTSGPSDTLAEFYEVAMEYRVE